MHDGEMGSGTRASVVLAEDTNALIELVCLAAHRVDPLDAKGYSVCRHHDHWAYCAQGADRNHDWVRVPATPLDRITTGTREERPPAPRTVR